MVERRKLTMFKMPFKSNLFNKNQKVWIVYKTGDSSAYVCGKYRGKGRSIRAWVNWEPINKPNPIYKEIEVTNEFYNKVVYP